MKENITNNTAQKKLLASIKNTCLRITTLFGSHYPKNIQSGKITWKGNICIESQERKLLASLKKSDHLNLPQSHGQLFLSDWVTLLSVIYLKLAQLAQLVRPICRKIQLYCVIATNQKFLQSTNERIVSRNWQCYCSHVKVFALTITGYVFYSILVAPALPIWCLLISEWFTVDQCPSMCTCVLPYLKCKTWFCDRKAPSAPSEATAELNAQSRFSHNTQSWQYWHLFQMHWTTLKECKRINFPPNPNVHKN